jgi:hypothetical protein
MNGLHEIADIADSDDFDHCCPIGTGSGGVSGLSLELLATDFKTYPTRLWHRRGGGFGNLTCSTRGLTL